MRVGLVVLAGCGAALWSATSCSDDEPAPTSSKRGDGPDVTVPARADQPLVVFAGRHAVRVAVRFEGAASSHGVVNGATVRYPDALGAGVELVRERVERGVEDWVVFPVEPGVRRVRMRIEPRAAGLRLVDRTLELVDASGTPRIRMAPPWIVDATGAHHPVGVEVEGCSVDRDPRGPWGRPVTSPDAASCFVDLVLPEHLTFPAVLDPLWTDTRGLITRRALHAATRLDDGLVLIAGGTSNDLTIASAELFDPGTETFAATGGMGPARGAHTQTLLTSGRVLAVGGGCCFGDTFASMARYDPLGGTWTEVAPLGVPRAHHAVVTLADGGVLVTGSFDDAAAIASRSVERCNPEGEACEPAAPMLRRRGGHSATLLPDGRVLVVGGAERMFTDGTSFHVDTELYDPAGDTWSPGPDMPDARVEHSAISVAGGPLVILGGTSEPQGSLMDDDVFAIDPISLGVGVLGELSVPRWLHAAALLPNGRVLLAGRGSPGYGAPTVVDAEAFDPSLGVSIPAGSLEPPRTFATATALLDGRVLVAGGKAALGPAEIDDAVLFGDRLGSPCDELDATSCPNGACVSGVCSAPGGAGGSGGSGAGGSGAGGSGAGGSGAGGSGGGSTGGGGEGTTVSSGGGGGAATATTGTEASSSTGTEAMASSSSGMAVGAGGSASAGATDSAPSASAGSFYGCNLTDPGPRGLSGAPRGALLAWLAAVAMGRRLRRKPRES